MREYVRRRISYHKCNERICEEKDTLSHMQWENMWGEGYVITYVRENMWGEGYVITYAMREYVRRRIRYNICNERICEEKDTISHMQWENM